MQISREDTRRRITIGVNVRQRDVASLVADIQSSLQENLLLPPGYSIQYGGQFENLEAARDRLSLAVPVALLMIFLLLYFAFGSFKYAILIYSAVPLSAIGGVAALLLRGMPFSISAGVGFIALFGVAVLNGIVLISYFNKLREEGKSDPREIVIEGGLVRLRPVVMTAAVASLGFLPMALSSSAGAEVQKPLATVVIGGLISATLLTLIVLPVLYYLTSARLTGKGSKLAAIALLLLLPAGLTAQSPPLTLEAVLQHARDNHPLLQQSALAVDKAYLMKKQSWDLPPLDVNIEYGQINAAAQDLRVNIVQGLGVLPAHIQRARLASTNIAFAEADLTRQQALLLNEVEMAWFTWLYYTQQVTAYRQMEQLYETIAEKSRLRKQTGDISGLDLQLALTAAAQARQATATAQMALQAATTQLQQVAWLENWPIAAVDTLPIMPWPGELSIPTPTLLLAPFEAQQQVLQQQWKLEQSQFFPNLHIGYFNQQLEKVGGFQGILAGATIPLWPLPQQSRVQQAALSLQQAAAATRQAAQEYQTTAMQLVVQANLLYEQTTSTLPLLKDQSIALREAANLEWEQGEIGQLQFLQLLEQALQLELQYLDGIHQYNQTLITWSLYAN